MVTCAEAFSVFLREGKYCLRGVRHTLSERHFGALCAVFFAAFIGSGIIVNARTSVESLLMKHPAPVLLHADKNMHDANTLYGTLRNMSFVRKLEFVTREELMQRSGLHELPDHDRFLVYPNDVFGYAYLGALLMQDDVRSLIHSSTFSLLSEEERIVQEVSEYASFLIKGMGGALAILLCCLFLLISASVRHRADRESIAMQELLGVKRQYISFFVYGALILGIAFFVSMSIGFSLNMFLDNPVDARAILREFQWMGIALFGAAMLSLAVWKGMRDHVRSWHIRTHVRQLFCAS